MKNKSVLLSFVLLLSLVSCDFIVVNPSSSNIDNSHNSSFIGDSNISPYLQDIFGENIRIYSSDEANPYNISLSSYGDNVKAIFYEPDINNYVDEYSNVSSYSFYNNYTRAKSYEDAYFRTFHNLMSGDISIQSHLPIEGGIKENNKYIRYSDALYVLDYSGDFIAYVINSNFEEPLVIYYGAAYTSLEEVAAYLLAFGEVPANSDYDSSNSGRSDSVYDWGQYGRCNVGEFYGNTSSYPHEPALPGNSSGLYYIETDFGTKGNYNLVSYKKTYNQTNYNNGSSITRGAARFCFVSSKYTRKIDDRYVFYTYNHYNDFQEYLNYYNGWGERFGNESGGNMYCYNRTDFNNSNKYPLKQYPETIMKERQ